MSFSAINFFIPIFGLAVNVIFHVLYVRLNRGEGRLKGIIFGFLVGGLCLFLSELFLIIEGSADARDVFPIGVGNLMIYGFLGYCYFHFVNLGETGRRVRILREIYDAKDGLTMEELLEKYNAGNIVDVRLARLLNSNQIILNKDRYCIGNTTMLLMSKIIVVLKVIILGKKSEFD